MPQLEANVRNEAANMPRTTRMQIDLMVNKLCGQTCAGWPLLQFTNSVGDVRMRWLGITEGHHELSHKGDNEAPAQEHLTSSNRWYCEHFAYLARKLAETPEPGGQGALLVNTLVVWTNELGKGNSHTLDNIPCVMVGNGLDFRTLVVRCGWPAFLTIACCCRWRTAWGIASSASATRISAATARWEF